MGTNTEMLVKSIVDLPTLPQVITTLMTMLDDPDASVRDINNIMGKDQTLVAKMLKLVNSAFYAIPKRVTSVSQAISILGFKTVKSIVLSASIIGMFDGDDEDFNYQEFWANSLGVGTISRYIILSLSDDPLSGCGSLHPDSGFVTGLLGGIGKVVLEQYCHDDFSRRSWKSCHSPTPRSRLSTPAIPPSAIGWSSAGTSPRKCRSLSSTRIR